MDKTSYENWVRVKETLEECGNTDNFYYRRACAIVSGQPDPMENVSVGNGTQDEWNQTWSLYNKGSMSRDDWWCNT